jgi:hypothetical protein
MAPRGNTQSRNGDMNYTFRNGVPSQIILFAQPVEQRNDVNADLGVYARDSWTLRRLTFNYAWVRLPECECAGAASAAGRFVPERNFAAVKNVPNWKDINPRLFCGRFTQALLDCDVTPPFLANYKAYAVYNLPWWGVQVSGTFQAVPVPSSGGMHQSILATYVATNRLRLSLDIYNVFSSNDIQTLNTRLSSNNAINQWQRPLSILSPRYLQIGTEFSF